MLNSKVSMKKKNGLLTAALLTTVVFMGSCSSEDNVMGTQAKPGSPISFSVLGTEPQARTVYEDRLQINWELGDEIGIYSPSSNVLLSGEKQLNGTVAYKVTTLNVDGHPYHAGIEHSEAETYLKWGKDLNSLSVFYGAYPQERITKCPTADGGIFQMQYITNQECKVYSSENGVYLTTPDMKNAYMMAKNQLMPNGDHVLLSFDPIMTTPDITITAGKYEVGTGIIQPITVTGVSVIMPKKLSSETLNYHITDLTNGSIENPRGELKDYADGQESVFIQIDNNGKKYIDLYEGESVNLMAFLPPIPNLTNAKIRVHTLGATDFVKTVPDELKVQSRITINLPDITPETTKPNNWISKLDGNTSLKEMSIPAYVCTSRELQNDIEALLKKGVRAFDAEKFMDSKHNLKESFVNVCNDYVSNKGKDEFLIVWVDNVTVNDINRPEGWIDFQSNIQSAKGHVILLEKYKDKFYRVNSKIFEKELFSSKTDVSSFDLNLNWAVWNNTDANKNKVIYDKIVGSNEQTGFTGIVTIPNAGVTYDKTYGDLLLQAVIDCNFKLH